MPKFNDHQSVSVLLSYLQSDLDAEPTPKLKLLQCFHERGVLTMEQVVTLSETTNKNVYRTLDGLCQEKTPRPAALRKATIYYEGKVGRPLNVYLLTEEGAQALKLLDPQNDVRAPQVSEFNDLVAVVAMMDVALAARDAGLQAQVEAVVQFGKAARDFFRPDVLVDLPQGRQVLIEFEQGVLRNQLHRITEKLLRLERFFRSERSRNVSHQVRVLFNMSETDTQTLGIWQEALALAVQDKGGKLGFQVYWMPITDFLAEPVWMDTRKFKLLTPLKTSSAREEDRELPDLEGGPILAVAETAAVLQAIDRVYRSQATLLIQAQEHRERSLHFFALMTLIYQASHYRDSPTLLYAAFPTASLRLLRHYLHAHQNRPLLEQLKRALPQVNTHNTGVTQLRDVMTHIVWDVFLKVHGFARGGPLHAVVRAPTLDEQRSDYYIHVRLDRWEMYSLEKPAFSVESERFIQARSLAWVLEAIFHYSQELGLAPPWWQVKKGKRGGR